MENVHTWIFLRMRKKAASGTILANRISNTFLLIMYAEINIFLTLKRGKALMDFGTYP